jgi:hypothetical protein
LVVKKHYFFPNITPLYLGWGNDGTYSINFPYCNSILACSSKTYYCKIEIRELYAKKWSTTWIEISSFACFLWYRGCLLHLGDEGVEGRLWMFWNFPTRPHLLQQIRLEVVANKNFVLQNLNENQIFLLHIVLIFSFQE